MRIYWVQNCGSPLCMINFPHKIGLSCNNPESKDNSHQFRNFTLCLSKFDAGMKINYRRTKAFLLLQASKQIDLFSPRRFILMVTSSSFRSLRGRYTFVIVARDCYVIRNFQLFDAGIFSSPSSPSPRKISHSPK